MLVTTTETLKPWPNIALTQSTFQDFLTRCPYTPDLIHIDIVHTYPDTYACGCMSLAICDMVLFHDTESFPEVKRACEDLTRLFGIPFRNYYECFGLGIFSRKAIR